MTDREYFKRVGKLTFRCNRRLWVLRLANILFEWGFVASAGSLEASMRKELNADMQEFQRLNISRAESSASQLRA